MFMIVSLLNLCADSFSTKAPTLARESSVSCFSDMLTSMLTLQLQRVEQPEAKDNCVEQTFFFEVFCGILVGGKSRWPPNR